MVTTLQVIVQMYYFSTLVWSVVLFGSGFGSFVVSLFEITEIICCSDLEL